MRIISGTFRGHTLLSPKGDAVRPTSEQLRGAIFNICQNYIEDALFLDLFAGSGAVGFEALSRGAKHVAFVEQDPLALQCIKKNIAKLGCENECTVISQDVFAAVKRLIKKGDSYEVIFLDPPYKVLFETCTELLQLIDNSSLLKPSGLLFLEKAPARGEKEEEGTFTNLSLKNKRTFGNTVLRQFENSSIPRII